MAGFSFPPDENKPRYVDIPLGPVDRIRSFLGWTAEGADPLTQPPENTLRMESGQLQYGVGVNGDEEPIIVNQ